MRFKVGDRVVFKRSDDSPVYEKWVGKKGTVRDSFGKRLILVKSDDGIFMVCLSHRFDLIETNFTLINE